MLPDVKIRSFFTKTSDNGACYLIELSRTLKSLDNFTLMLRDH